MRLPWWRTAAVVVVAGLGLAGCTRPPGKPAKTGTANDSIAVTLPKNWHEVDPMEGARVFQRAEGHGAFRAVVRPCGQQSVVTHCEHPDLDATALGRVVGFAEPSRVFKVDTRFGRGGGAEFEGPDHKGEAIFISTDGRLLILVTIGWNEPLAPGELEEAQLIFQSATLKAPERAW